MLYIGREPCSMQCLLEKTTETSIQTTHLVRCEVLAKCDTHHRDHKSEEE